LGKLQVYKERKNVGHNCATRNVGKNRTDMCELSIIIKLGRKRTTIRERMRENNIEKFTHAFMLSYETRQLHFIFYIYTPQTIEMRESEMYVVHLSTKTTVCLLLSNKKRRL
jgi:hypothetical protein